MDGSCIEAESLETATGNLRREEAGGAEMVRQITLCEEWEAGVEGGVSSPCLGHAAVRHMHRHAPSLNFLPTLRYVIDGRYWLRGHQPCCCVNLWPVCGLEQSFTLDLTPAFCLDLMGLQIGE